MGVGIGVALGTSLVNLEPTCIFNFLNTAEIFSQTSGYKLNLDSASQQFLKGLQLNSFFPNPVSYMLNFDKSSGINRRLTDSNSNSDLFIVKSGVKLSVLALLLFIFIAALGLSRCRIKLVYESADKLKKKFKFTWLLRYYLISLFELYLNSITAILHFDLKITIYVIDFIISCCTIVFAI
jgi:hypothetical protein